MRFYFPTPFTVALLAIFLCPVNTSAYSPASYGNYGQMENYGASMRRPTMSSPCYGPVAYECQSFCSASFDPSNITCSTMSLKPFRTGRIDCTCSTGRGGVLVKPINVPPTVYITRDNAQNSLDKNSKYCYTSTFMACQKFCQTNFENYFTPICVSSQNENAYNYGSPQEKSFSCMCALLPRLWLRCGFILPNSNNDSNFYYFQMILRLVQKKICMNCYINNAIFQENVVFK